MENIMGNLGLKWRALEDKASPPAVCTHVTSLRLQTLLFKHGYRSFG
jgi:hypothetical protein